MLKIRELRKTYGSSIQALKGISIDVPPGVFGLLGPNGAGKTTLMKILATLLEPDAGTVEINGFDLISRKDKARRLLGYLPQDFGLYPTLTAEQMLNYFAKLKGVTDKRQRRDLIDALFERVNLSDARKQRLGGFSGGMRQRLGIAQALIGQPQLIIVDEPIDLLAYFRVYGLILLPSTIFVTAVAVLANIVLRNKHVAYVFSIGTAAGLFYLYSTRYNQWLYNPVLHGLWTYADLAGAGNNQATILIHRIYCLAVAIACLSLAHLFFQRKSSKGFRVDGTSAVQAGQSCWPWFH